MKLNYSTILLVLVSVLLTLQIKSCLTPTPPNERLIRAEERIRSIEEKRLADSVFHATRIAWYDSLISASKTRSAQLAVTYKTVKEKYEKVPDVVRSYDRDQLRREWDKLIKRLP